MEAFSLTPATWFWLVVPMPLLIVWAIWTYVKEGGSEE
ncbi:hypothetical protein CathTA2_3051 [Caldalkalibacillus thermarum TA2.A1]|uniref:Uncharacterized protein n=1 Tax=Caldalkalibacillus thermarum (strain TA2.A1) TaxID=986075 RepID=F5LAW6_CALTT|nr:hypothetical protein CathTA2_3051 [Caldalkalibacillus thermarum TA2.A1]